MASLLHSPVPFYLISLIFFSLRLVDASLISQSPTTANETDIHDLIPLYGLPPGLIPGNVRSYKLQDSGYFVVILNTPCYVNFEELNQKVYYGTDIRGRLSNGGVTEVSGIQAKQYFFWLSVTRIKASEDGDTIRFFAGPLYRTFPTTAFSEIPACESQVSLRNPLKLVGSSFEVIN